MKTSSINLEAAAEKNVRTTQSRHIVPIFIIGGMLCTLVILSAVLPLYGLWFHTALLTPWQPLLLLPSHLLFPGWNLTPTLLGMKDIHPPLMESWICTGLLFGCFLLIAVFYALAILYLPGYMTKNRIVFCTILLGMVYICLPVVTSQDLFSYVIYARMSVLYHLNPLVATPLAITHDPIFVHLYWKNQPSAYGPTWIALTALLQWLTTPLGINSATSMVLILRILGLLAHLWSIVLVWSISGHIQSFSSAKLRQRRIQALLAFAFNPLLLFEGCTNAHNDTLLLFLILLAIWCLVRTTAKPILSRLLVIIVLAIATCLKANVILLLPGYLLFLWTQPQRIRLISQAVLLYAGTLVLLYIPFWQHGAILNVLQVNPGTYRTINTFAEFLTHFLNSLLPLLGSPVASDSGSPVENTLRTLCTITFVTLYAWFVFKAMRPKYALTSKIQLIRWMTLIWFLYCIIGSPWFWPWYIVTFFGLFALLDTTGELHHEKLGQVRIRLTVYLLAFSMLSIYCFYSYAPYASMLPGLASFRWAYLRGLWTWGLPLLLFIYYSYHGEKISQSKKAI